MLPGGHGGGLDHEQHGSGPFSPASLATLERIDALIGALVASAERVHGRDVVIAIVSDHGFQRTTRAVNLIHALRAAGLVDYAPGVVLAQVAAIVSDGGWLQGGSDGRSAMGKAAGY